jgi:hypothetical protein
MEPNTPPRAVVDEDPAPVKPTAVPKPNPWPKPPPPPVPAQFPNNTLKYQSALGEYNRITLPQWTAAKGRYEEYLPLLNDYNRSYLEWKARQRSKGKAAPADKSADEEVKYDATGVPISAGAPKMTTESLAIAPYMLQRFENQIAGQAQANVVPFMGMSQVPPRAIQPYKSGDGIMGGPPPQSNRSAMEMYMDSGSAVEDLRRQAMQNVLDALGRGGM